MKVIFCNPIPYWLCHGGEQIRIEETIAALRSRGVSIIRDEWWVPEHHPDIIHFAGRPSPMLLRMAAGRNIATVFTETLDQTASRSRIALWGQHWAIRLLRIFGRSMFERMGWESYQLADAICHNVSLENRVAEYLFDAPRDKLHTVPLGLSDHALKALSAKSASSAAERYCLCIGTIHPRKNSLLLAQAAKLSQVPVVFIGRPYSENESYFQSFLSLVDQKHVRYKGEVSEEEKISLLTNAQGFVLLSNFESGCIAVHEAAASGLPMLLPKKKWTSVYPVSENIVHIDTSRTAEEIAFDLSRFYKTATRRNKQTFPVGSWGDTAAEYERIYIKIINKRRRS